MHENNTYCFLLRMANLLFFIFMMVEFEKLQYSPDLKMVLIFLVTKVFKRLQCSNEFMFNFHMRC